MYLFEGIIASTCVNVEAVKKEAKIKVLTIIDFTKTYHSPPKIHGLSIESVDFDSCDLKPKFLLIFPDDWQFLVWQLGSVWLVVQILRSLSCNNLDRHPYLCVSNLLSCCQHLLDLPVECDRPKGAPTHTCAIHQNHWCQHAIRYGRQSFLGIRRLIRCSEKEHVEWLPQRN